MVKMSEPTQVDRIAQLFTEYWVRDHGQASLDALQDMLTVQERAWSNACMAEAFIDVVGVDITHVQNKEHHEIWMQAAVKIQQALLENSAKNSVDGREPSVMRVGNKADYERGQKAAHLHGAEKGWEGPPGESRLFWDGFADFMREQEDSKPPSRADSLDF